MGNLSVECEELRREEEAEAMAVVRAAEAVLAGAGRRVCGEVRVGDAATEILKLAEERDADLIVAGARGVSWLAGRLVGSVADRLLKEARCSVLVAWA